MTLKQFIKKAGGQDQAAVQLGVRGSTIWRWLTKKSKPQPLAVRRLRELGVEVA